MFCFTRKGVGDFSGSGFGGGSEMGGNDKKGDGVDCGVGGECGNEECHESEFFQNISRAEELVKDSDVVCSFLLQEFILFYFI